MTDTAQGRIVSLGRAAPARHADGRIDINATDDPGGHRKAKASHERAAETHGRAAELHQESANFHEEHAAEMWGAGNTTSAERAERIADRERELADRERGREEEQRRSAEAEPVPEEPPPADL